MMIFRFMSKEEFDKYNRDEVLVNTTEHIAKTNSIGFCFFDMITCNPEYASNFVSGIVNLEICAVFEVDKKYLKETYGIYHNPKYRANSLLDAVMSWNDETHKMKVKEYCTTQYSNKNFKLIRYSEDILRQHFITNKEKFNWKEGIKQ